MTSNSYITSALTLILVTGGAWTWRSHELLLKKNSELQIHINEQASIINHLNEEILADQNKINFETQKLQSAEDERQQKITALEEKTQLKTQEITALQQKLQTLQGSHGDNDTITRLQLMQREQFAVLQKLEGQLKELSDHAKQITQAKSNGSPQNFDAQIQQLKLEVSGLQSQIKQDQISQTKINQTQKTLTNKINQRTSLQQRMASINQRYQLDAINKNPNVAADGAVLASLQQQVTNLDNDITNLQAIKDSPPNNGQISALQDQVTARNNEIKSLQQRKAQNTNFVQENHQAVDEEMAYNKKSRQSIESQYSAAVKDYRQTQDQIRAVNNSEQGNEKIVLSIRQDLAREQTELDKLNQDLATERSALQELEK